MINIAGYEVVDKFTTTGGGRCEWAFATKAGRTYFLKRFLQPKPVVPGQLGGEKTLARQRHRCEQFEARQNKILAALKGKTGSGGNLIAPIACFPADGCYYKVTEKIDTKGITTSDVSTLPVEAQLIILRSAANSVRILHSSGIAHGDIKTDNVLIRSREGGLMTASLIDFDDSYFAHAPPLPPEEFVFDPAYAAPEAFAFVADPTPELASRLGCAADIFSLGMVFCEYLTGKKPGLPRGSPYSYTGEVMLSGGTVELPLPAQWKNAEPLLRAMLVADIEKRPRVSEVLEELKHLPGRKLETSASPPAGLRINLGAPKSVPAPATTSATPALSPLRGKLSRKSD